MFTAIIAAASFKALIATIAVLGVVMLMIGMADASSPNLQDSSLTVTRALPATATTVTSTAIDTGAAGPNDYQPARIEYLLTAPALNVTQLPNAATMTYAVIGSANSDLSSPTTLFFTVITQTGAGGVGAAAPTPYRFRLASNAPRYIGFTATGVGNGDCSGVSATLTPVV